MSDDEDTEHTEQAEHTEHTDPTDNECDPECKKGILKALHKFKMELIQTATLDNQSPQSLIEVRTILRRNGKILKDYIQRREMPNNPSKDLEECIDSLEKLLTRGRSYIYSI